MDLAGDDGPDDVGDDAFEGPSSLAADAKNAEVGGEPVEGSQFRGSSASAGERMNMTPCSTRRDPRKRPHQESPVEAQSETKRLMRMLAQDREDNIRANDKARQENLDFMKNFLRDTVPGLVSVIAKEVFTSMHAASVAPLQMIEPSPSSQQLLLANQAHGSFDTSRKSSQGSTKVSLTETTPDPAQSAKTLDSGADMGAEDVETAAVDELLGSEAMEETDPESQPGC